MTDVIPFPTRPAQQRDVPLRLVPLKCADPPFEHCSRHECPTHFGADEKTNRRWRRRDDRNGEIPEVLWCGTLFCGERLVARRQNAIQTTVNQQWILGFLSGIGWSQGASGIDPLNGTDAKGVWAWVDNYCRVHPLATIGSAGPAFVQEHPR